MKKEKYSMVEILADNGASEIMSCYDIDRTPMTNTEWKSVIYEKFGENGISEIIFS